MLNIGLSNKVKFELNTTDGFPRAIATSRILQGEPIETVCAHDVNLVEGAMIFKISRAFANCLKPNPVKIQKLNSTLEEIVSAKRKELLESGELVSQEDLENLTQSEEVIGKLNEFHWMDFLTGFVSLYTVADFPNADVEWNESIKTWQVVATTEILPDQIINLPKPKEE
jgi:hypothetical protein